MAEAFPAVLTDETLFFGVTSLVNLELAFGEVSVATELANELFLAEMERVEMGSERVLGQEARITDLKV